MMKRRPRTDRPGCENSIHFREMPMNLRIGILTSSDRVSRGVMEDLGGAAVQAGLQPIWEVIRQAVVPDDVDRISETLKTWADGDRLDVIFTTGGTGLGPRDVTPEATMQVVNRLVPGIAEAMRRAGQEHTPAAMLSRAVVGLRGNTLIVNLPGSPKGAAEGVAAVAPILEHAIATVRGGRHE